MGDRTWATGRGRQDVATGRGDRTWRQDVATGRGDRTGTTARVRWDVYDRTWTSGRGRRPGPGFGPRFGRQDLGDRIWATGFGRRDLGDRTYAIGRMR